MFNFLLSTTLCIFSLSFSMELDYCKKALYTENQLQLWSNATIPQHLCDAGVVAVWKTDTPALLPINDLMKNFNGYSIVTHNDNTFLINNKSPLITPSNGISFINYNHVPLDTLLVTFPDSTPAMVHVPSKTAAPLQNNISLPRVEINYLPNPPKGLQQLLPEKNTQAYKMPEVSFDKKQLQNNTLQRTRGFGYERPTISHGNLWAKIKQADPEPYIVREPKVKEYTEQEIKQIADIAKATQAKFDNYLANRGKLIQTRINDYAKSLIDNRDQMRIDTASKRALINELEKNRIQLQKELQETDKHLKSLLPKNFTGKEKLRFQDNATMVYFAKLQTSIDNMQLALAKIEDDIAVLNRTVVMNDEYVRRICVIKEKGLLDLQPLDECKNSLIKFNEQKKQVSKELGKYAQEKQNHDFAIKETEKQLKSAWTNRGLKALQEKQMQHIEVMQNAEILFQEKNNDLKIIEETITHCESLITQREQENFRTIAQKMYQGEQVDLPSDAKSSGLIQAVDKSIQEYGALHKETIALDQRAKTALEKMGLKLPETCVIEYEGDHAQLYVYKELVGSLNKMGAVSISNIEVQQLLKQAVVINNSGRTLVGQHKLDQALSAKLTCDALVDYAKTIGDLGKAVGEGMIEGVWETGKSLGIAGKSVLDAVSYPEETLSHVKSVFNKAVLAVSNVIAEEHKNRELIYRVLQKDEAAIKEWQPIEDKSRKECAEFVEDIIQYFQETPLRDHVKGVSKFLTECAALNQVGSFLGQALKG